EEGDGPYLQDRVARGIRCGTLRLVAVAAEDRQAADRDVPAARHQDIHPAEEGIGVDCRAVEVKCRLPQVGRDRPEDTDQRAGLELLRAVGDVAAAEDRDGRDAVLSADGRAGPTGPVP